MKSPENHASRLQYLTSVQEKMVSTIRQMVEMESPSDDKLAVNRLSELIAGKFSAMGGKVSVHPGKDFGQHLQIDFSFNSKAKPVLLLGHYDTVYPIGTLGSMPCRVKSGTLSGPGVLDMKSGIAMIMHAIDALQKSSGRLPRPVSVFLVSDEEVGSSSSRMMTEKLAKASAAVLVLEPSYGPRGAVKTARKGVGEYLVKVTGKAAHSGLDFEKGANAIVELARQVEKIASFTDLDKGLTMNVGKVSGGSRTNVVPQDAEAQVDVRIARMKDAAGINKKMFGLQVFDWRCKLEVTGGMNRPPLERTSGVASLYKRAVGIARDLGWQLDEAAVGGGSDGNFTAALGIPTLDGLGGVGDGAHASHEHILISELPRRTALLAGLIESA